MIGVFYKTLYVSTGVDYGLFEFKTLKIRVIVYCLSVIQTVTFSSACMLLSYYYDMTKFTGTAILFIQHLSYVFIFMLMDKKVKLSGFLSIVKNVDLNLKTNRKSANNFERNILVFFLSIIAYRIIVTIFACLTGLCHEGVMKNIFYFIICITRDMTMFNNAYLLYQIKSRLARLAVLLESDHDDVTDTHSYHRLYKSICDVCLRVKEAYDPVFITNVLGNMLDTMMVIYSQVKYLKLYNTTGWELRDAVSIFAWSITTLLTFLPAIFGGALSTETEQIKSILHRKLIEETDMHKVVQIEKFIKYIEARLLKFTVYKVIPLDAGLPGVVLHICVTYLIVIIQFSHLG